MKKLPLILHLSLFISILLGGMFLRFENLGRQSLWMDEGYTINAVISGMQNGTRNFASILDSGERYFCPMYCLPTKLALGIGNWELGSKNSEPRAPIAESRIPAAVFGTLFILIAYWIAKLFFKDRWIALLAMFLTSFSYIQIAWSRQARWYTELEVFFWLALGCFYWFLKTGPATPLHNYPLTPRTSDSSPAPLSSIHSPPTPLASERGALLSRVIPILLSKLPSPFRRGAGGEAGKREGSGVVVEKGWRNVIWLLASIIFTLAAILTHPIAYALPVIMLAWFVIEKRPSFKHLAIAIGAIGIFVAFTEYGLGLHSLSANLTAHFSLHQNLFYYASFYWRNYWLFILFAIIGLILADKEQRKNSLMLALPFLICFIGLSFFTEAIEYRYVFHTTVAFYALGAVGFISGLKALATRHWLEKDGGFLKTKLLYALAIVPCVILLLSGHLILTPQSFYWLEADDPATVGIRDYYAYTPQPDWNQAYNAIKDQLKPDDLVISSHPHFNKIFLNQAGYWLAHDYMRRGNEISKDQMREFYVNAEIIHDLDELKTLTASRHGFIVFDLQSTDGRIPKETIDFIKANTTLIFNFQSNSYSEIWVYRF